MRTERGSVLVHVLLTGVVVALIAATLLRMSLLRYQMAGRSEKMLKEKRANQGGLASVMSAWNSVNTSCANNVPASSGFTCSGTVAPGPPGVCGCTCVQSSAPDSPFYPHAIYTCPNDGGSCNSSRVASPAPVAGCTLGIVSTDIQ